MTPYTPTKSAACDADRRRDPTPIYSRTGIRGDRLGLEGQRAPIAVAFREFARLDAEIEAATCCV